MLAIIFREAGSETRERGGNVKKKAEKSLTRRLMDLLAGIGPRRSAPGSAALRLMSTQPGSALAAQKTVRRDGLGRSEHSRQGEEEFSRSDQRAG